MTLKEFIGKLDVIAVLGFLIAIETQITNGSMSFVHTLPPGWIDIVKEWAANLATVGALLVSIVRMSGSSSPAPSVTSTVIKILIGAFLLSAFLAGSPAMAQTTRHTPPAMTGNIVQDIKTDLNNAGIKAPTVTAGAACDFNIFALLNPQNVVTMIQNCVSDANKPFLPDVQAALDSATAAKDKPGMDCLAPALAIVQAAVGTPAVVAPDGTVTTQAKMAGIILIFQKFREFTLANGPAACKNWVQSTINGAVSGTL